MPVIDVLNSAGAGAVEVVNDVIGVGLICSSLKIGDVEPELNNGEVNFGNSIIGGV